MRTRWGPDIDAYDAATKVQLGRAVAVTKSIRRIDDRIAQALFRRAGHVPGARDTRERIGMQVAARAVASCSSDRFATHALAP